MEEKAREIGNLDEKLGSGVENAVNAFVEFIKGR